MPLNFFLFALPAWQLIAGWLLTLAVITCLLAVFFILITGGTRVLSGHLSRYAALPWRGLSITLAFLLLIVAIRAYIGRFELLLEDHTIFGGVTYTDAHVTLTGMLVVCAALVLGAAIAALNAVRVPRGRWLVAAILPAPSVISPFKESPGTSAALSLNRTNWFARSPTLSITPS